MLLIAGQFDLSVGSRRRLRRPVLLATTAPAVGIPTAVLCVAIAGGLPHGTPQRIPRHRHRRQRAHHHARHPRHLPRPHPVHRRRPEHRHRRDFDWAIAAAASSASRSRPWCSLAVAIAVALLLRNTVYGRTIYAIGANPNAARLVGIRANRNLFIAFMLSGLCIALAGLLTPPSSGQHRARQALGLELAVVTAVILGGDEPQRRRRRRCSAPSSGC